MPSSGSIDANVYHCQSAPKPIDTIALSKHVKIKDVEPDESLPLNAFHLALTSDEDSDYLFYTDDSVRPSSIQSHPLTDAVHVD